MHSSLPNKPAREPLVGLPPPQFRLQTLLLVVTGLAVLIALAKWWSTPVIVAVVFLLISIGLHVAGNALGTKLRKNRGRGLTPADVAENYASPPLESHPLTKLALKYELGKPIRYVTIACGILGASAGCTLTWYQNGQQAGWENYLVAVIAFGALGGFWSFLTVGFLQVILGAIFQASGSTSTPSPGQREPE